MSISRYDKYTKNNGKYYDFTLYPEILINLTDFILIYPNLNDRLDLIAKRYLGDSKLWWIIALVNKLLGDTLMVEPLTKLYVPKEVYKFV